MIDKNFRVLFGDDDWHDPQASVVLVCRHTARSRGDREGWNDLSQALARIAESSARSRPENNLALAVLATLAEADVRLPVVAKVRDLVAEASETKLRAITKRTARIVDRRCREQDFGFRATLTLISMMVADQARQNRLLS
jgi:hypothetical protein